MRGGFFQPLLAALPRGAKWLRARRVSAIVSSYNRSHFLRLCVVSLEMQTRPPDEVIIADDGSDPEHVAAIEQIIKRSPLKILLARQEHDGYRLAANRNQAARHATGDQYFFSDGDVVLFPDAIERHLVASGWRRWVTGYGIRLTPEETRRVTEDTVRGGRLDEIWPGWGDPRGARLCREARRFRRRALKARLWPGEARFRRLMLITMQATVPREAFERINGFDENFAGWGSEDIDLGLRLLLAGVRGRTVEDTSRAIHLYHDPLPPAGRNLEYHQRPRHGEYRCRNGLRHGGGGPPP